MGSGNKKAHEAFTIAPAPEALDDPDTVSVVEVNDQVPAAGKKCVVCGKPVSEDDVCSQCFMDMEKLLDPTDVNASETVDPAAPSAPAADQTEAAVAPAPTVEQAPPPGQEPEVSTDPDQAQWGDDDLLTPIPDELKVGDGIGTAVAVGGADLLDGAAILTAYQDPKGGPSPEVLRATLTPDAEEKLLDALSPPDAPKVPIQVPEVVTGRLPIDQEQQLHEELAKAAKSINHHIKDGTPIPQHTLDRVASVDEKLQALQATVPAGGAEEQMIAHYQAAVDQCKQRIAPDFATPYAEGGKIPMVNAFETTGEVMVTKMVPDPTFQGAGLPVTQRTMSRVAANASDGVSTWDGTSREQTTGTELAIDLGNGYQAVVRPTSMNPPGQCAASLRGTVEVIAPPGAGHQQQLLEQLGHLNIVNRPMNAAEAEWTYLQRNIAARGLEKHAAVTAAIQSAADLEDAHAHSLLMKRAPQAIGLDDAGLAQFARKLQLDAEADALRDKVRLLKDGVAQALGHADGAAMAKAVSYDPKPHRARGWLTWGRIGQSDKDLKPLFANKCISHSITGGHHNLSNVLTSGVLACTERRRMMGVQKGIGMSEQSDMTSGGASSIFVRMQPKGAHLGGARLIWNSPEKLLSRTDWYAYNGDHFGAAIAGTGHSISGQTRDPHQVAKFSGGSNEVMISHGLDLLGADAPDKVVCPASYRKTLLADLAKAGITTIGGRPVEKVVVSG
ncbi:hypothetical protein [Mycobacterium hubeiense]|uniref:hypothetical protein n=1 Tax=Mycobacterium hubeiense TaxID=1867256 RepID=UPI000C7EBF5D|nr:hypothetical protein [Mycobacterium sp. QGD 101]